MRLSISFKVAVFFFVAVFCLAPACSKKEQAGAGGAPTGNRPPVIKTISIEPSQDTLKAMVTSEDPDGDQVTYSYQWLLNGGPIVGETQNEISGKGFSPEDKIAVRITPTDGKEEGKPVDSQPLQLKNSPPVITQIKITPDPAGTTDTLKAEVEGADPENDRIELAFQWFKDGQEIPDQTSGTLAPGFLEKGKFYTVKVTPSDAYGKGETKSSAPLGIGDILPKIVSSPPVAFDQGVYRYAVKVEDPDSQEFTYTLTEAPEGMKISPEGVIEWTPRPDQTGNFTVEIKVDDKEGGWTTQRYGVNLQATK